MSCVESEGEDIHRSLCHECCGTGKDLLLCDFCTKVFHSNVKCLIYEKANDLKRYTSSDEKWKCPVCKYGEPDFSFADVTSPEDYVLHLNLFDTSEVITSKTTDIKPTLGILLLSLEWIASPVQLEQIAKCVSLYYSVARDKDFILSTPTIHTSVNFRRLFESLTTIIGKSKFDQLCLGLKDRNDMVAVIGLAPSVSLLRRKCRGCGALRYFRTFCHHCGALHNCKKDLSSVLTHNKKKLPALFEAKESKQDKISRIETYSALGMRAIVRYITMTGNKANFREEGYKMVLLFMYLAMNCTGKHRQFAAKHFREMCGRFSEQLDHYSDIDNEDFNHMTTVTSALVLTQLTNLQSQAFYMFCDGAEEPNKEHGCGSSSTSTSNRDKKVSGGAYHSAVPKTGGWPKGVSRSQMTAAKSQSTTKNAKSTKSTAASAAPLWIASIASEIEFIKRKRASSASEESDGADEKEESGRILESDGESDIVSRPRHRQIPVHSVKRVKSAAVVDKSNSGSGSALNRTNNSSGARNSNGICGSAVGGAVDLTEDSPPAVVVKTEITATKQSVSVSTFAATATVPSTVSLCHKMDVIDLCSSSESESEPEEDNKQTAKPAAIKPLPKAQTIQSKPAVVNIKSSPSNSTTSSSNSNVSSGNRTRGAVRTAVQELGYFDDEEDEELFNVMVASWLENEAHKEKMNNSVSNSSSNSNNNISNNKSSCSGSNNKKNNSSSNVSDHGNSGGHDTTSSSKSIKLAHSSSIIDDIAAEVIRPTVSAANKVATAAPTATTEASVRVSAAPTTSTATAAAAIASSSVESDDLMSEDDGESPADSAVNSSANSSANSTPASSPTTTQRVTRLAANTAFNSAIATATQQSLFGGDDDNNNAFNSNDSTLDIIKSYAVLNEKLIRAVTYNYQSHEPMECTRKFDFSTKKPAIPLTPAEHCGYCGHNDKIDRDDVVGNSSNSSRQGKKIKYERETVRNTGKYKKNNNNSSSGDDKKLVCVKCDNRVVPHICHDTITDSLFASYAFQAIGLNLDLTNLGNKYVSKMLRILPLVRSYETMDAIGDDFFKHQCYFVTHLIYIFSNYGEHVLNRELFGEEFVFMVSQMFIVCDTLKDPEIAGEFVHCLKILQYNEDSDPEIAPIVRHALDFLVSAEKVLKGVRQGYFADNCFYNKYHSSFCAAVALLDASYVSEKLDPRKPFPTPRILSMFLSLQPNDDEE